MGSTVEMCSHGEGDVEARVDEERSAGRVADLLHAHGLVEELTVDGARVTVLHGEPFARTEREREPS